MSGERAACPGDFSPPAGGFGLREVGSAGVPERADGSQLQTKYPSSSFPLLDRQLCWLARRLREGPRGEGETAHG